MASEHLTKRWEIMRSAVTAMTAMMNSFESVIEKENAAIARSDINELESITQEKIHFGSKLEEAIHFLQHQIQETSSLMSDAGCASGERIEDFVQQLREFQGKLASSDGDRQIDELIDHINVMRETRWRLFPKIEANSYMVKRLLQFHRETYAFWQSVAQQSESIYGHTGKSRAATQRSILTVRT